MSEETVVFGKSTPMIGVITDPPKRQVSADRPAVVLLNSGIVHRVGPNRLYVRMARTLADMGYVVLRFDFSGIGDSGPRADTLPFVQGAIAETQAAMDFLCANRAVSRFVLAGICSGALISLRVAASDPRVVGAISINLAGHRSRNGLYYGRTLLRHYKRIAFSKSFGLRACRNTLFGKIDFAVLLQAMRSLGASLFAGNHSAANQPDPFATLLRQLVDRGVRLALVHSEGDEGLDYMYLVLGHEIRQWVSEDRLAFVLIPGANHTFTLLQNQEDLLDAVREWMAKLPEGVEHQVTVGG